MAVTAYVFPSFIDALNSKTVNVTTDTLEVLLVASGTYTWNSTANAAVHVHDFLTANGTLTEVSGGGYSRQTLTSVTTSDTFSTPHNYTSRLRPVLRQHRRRLGHDEPGDRVLGPRWHADRHLVHVHAVHGHRQHRRRRPCAVAGELAFPDRQKGR
jgi:hypothetical protein